jgi:hypothetical protein
MNSELHLPIAIGADTEYDLIRAFQRRHVRLRGRRQRIHTL